MQLDTPTHDIVENAYNSHPSQITFTPGSGINYITLNNAHGPFRNEDLRKAVWAVIDRSAVARIVGGALVAQPMTHFIYPGTNGFDQSGGYAGPQTDFNQSVTGNMAVARKYMKLAGYPSGRYTGGATLQVVGASNGDLPEVTQILTGALMRLGFRTHVTNFDAATMFDKYCGVPKQEIDVCTSAGWIRDFADPLTEYDPYKSAGFPITRACRRVAWRAHQPRPRRHAATPVGSASAPLPPRSETTGGSVNAHSASHLHARSRRHASEQRTAYGFATLAPEGP